MDNLKNCPTLLMPIFLTEQNVEQLLTMNDALRLVEDAFRELGNGAAQNQPRQRIRAPHGVLNVMPAGIFTRGYMGFKAYTSFRGGARFYFHLFDGNSGEYLAIIEADRLGQMRTGAASGVATKFLARQDSKTIGIIGTGWQAESQLQAVCAVREFGSVKCFSRDETRRKQFAEKMSAQLNIAIEPVASTRDAIVESDVVIAITTAAQPVVMGEWLRAGAHINAAGGNWAARREVDSAAVKRAHAIFADSVEQAKIEAGDLILAVSENAIGWEKVQEMSALVSGRAVGRASEDDITLFKSCGIALEDVAVGTFVYERAREMKIGTELKI
ncbi:MAG: ornithine cyclodeaminase family protein [Chloroflexota bacterium]|nr:MAG: ornithine cyclodeaminase family protein [Chloroflexota bacterium]